MELERMWVSLGISMGLERARPKNAGVGASDINNGRKPSATALTRKLETRMS